MIVVVVIVVVERVFVSSGPSDSGSRSTSGDAGEGKLTIRIESEVHTTRHIHKPYKNTTTKNVGVLELSMQHFCSHHKLK